MSPKGPPPKKPEDRRRRNAPEAGEWSPAPGEGWQHGPIPKAPTGMMPASRAAWRTWFGSWFASNWTPANLPGLRQVILLFDQVERGEFSRMTELRLQQKAYGITPEGQQSLRWSPPVEDPARKSAAGGRYADLRVVPD